MKVSNHPDRFSFFIVIILLNVVLGLGTIYLPTRLYLIGEKHQETVLAIELKTTYITTSNGQVPMQMPIDYSAVTLTNYPKPFETPSRNYTVGEKVNLLYSDRLHLGVIVPDKYGYFRVLYNYKPTYGWWRILAAIIIFMGLAIAIPIRSQRLIAYLMKSLKNSWHETMRDKKRMIEKVVAVTDFLSQLSTMFVAVSCVFVFIVLVLKAILLVEQTGLFLTTVTLIAASYLLFTSSLEKIIDTIIKIKRNEIFRNLLLILRNLVATGAGGIVVYKLIIFTIQVDFHKFETIKGVFRELISFLLT